MRGGKRTSSTRSIRTRSSTSRTRQIPARPSATSWRSNARSWAITEETRAAVIAIAAASGLRVRQILLRDQWWNVYSGRMEAFRKHDELHGALIGADATG